MSELSWTRKISKWDDVCTDIERFDYERIKQLSVECVGEVEKKFGPLTMRTPVKGAKNDVATFRWKESKNKNPRGEFMDALENRLITELPYFYGREGWAIGNETFGGCACCSLPNAIGTALVGNWVADELKTMIQCVALWKPIIEKTDTALSEHFARTQKFDEALFESTVLAMIDVMADYGWLSESWYHFLDNGVAWLLNSLTGIAPDDERLTNLSSSAFSFSSWTAPAKEKQRAFATSTATLAEALLRQNAG